MKKLLRALVLLVGTVLLTALAFGCKKECEHTHCEWVVLEEATCGSWGKKQYVCRDCDTVIKESYVPKLTSHTYGEWVVDTEATCTEDGIAHRVCTVCGREEKTVTKAKGHDWGEWTPVSGEAVKCEAEYEVQRVCAVCGKIETDTKTKYHEWGEHLTASGEVYEWGYEGEVHWSCTVCGKTITEQVGHFCAEAYIVSRGTINIYKGVCVHCGQEVTIELEGKGDVTDWEFEKATSCYSYVSAWRTDKDSGFEYDEEFFVRHQYVNGVCEFCGRKEPGQNGQSITFGSYPQSAVTDEALIKKLKGYIAQYPKIGDAEVGGWKPLLDYASYTEDSFWYIDVENSSNKYRAVYRLSKDGTNNLSWYKWEPLTWSVLENNEDSMLLLCDVSVDRQIVDLDLIKSYDFDESTIRTWLNETFYQWAFSATEKSRVLNTQVPQYHEDGITYSENKVFLLSEEDVFDSVFGLAEWDHLYIDDEISYEPGHPALEKTATDYAKRYEQRRWCYVLYRSSDPCYYIPAAGQGCYSTVNDFMDIVPMIVISK